MRHCREDLGQSRAALRGGRCGFTTVHVLLLVWGSFLFVGLLVMFQYSSTPGAESQITTDWPVESEIEFGASPRLMLFAHPRCPCTRASINELSRIMTRCNGRVDTVVVFAKPLEFADDGDWEKTDLWKSAEAIPGVSVYCDHGGVETARFGATTSGHTLLYSANRRLLFEGGITSSRGHCGDNAGESAIIDRLRGIDPSLEATPVYGCALSTPNEENTATKPTNRS